MNIIFAVANKIRHEYNSLSQEIRGASIGLLDSGENIADLIKAQYEVGHKNFFRTFPTLFAMQQKQNNNNNNFIFMYKFLK